MLASVALKNWILALLVILIAHFVVQNAILETRAARVVVAVAGTRSAPAVCDPAGPLPVSSAASAPASAEGAVGAEEEEDMLRYVYESEPGAGGPTDALANAMPFDGAWAASPSSASSTLVGAALVGAALG